MTPDDDMLDVALMKYAPSCRIYSQQIGESLPLDISQILKGLDKKSVRSGGDIIAGQKQLAMMSNAKNTKQLGPASKIAQLTAAISNSTTDVANYNAFITSRNTTTSTSSWASVIQAYNFNKALDPTQGGGVFF